MVINNKIEIQNRNKAEFDKKNLFIKAGAGAGKTTLLSKRITNLLSEGENPETFAVITYTKTGANELKDKIRSSLYEKLKEENLPGEVKQNINNSLNKLDLMQISTIHAFLFRVLKEYSFQSGLSLDAVKMETKDDEERKESFINSWIKEHTVEISGLYPDWQVNNTNYLTSAISNTFMTLSNVREEIVLNFVDEDAYFERRFKEYVSKYYTKMKKFADEMINDPPKTKTGKDAALNGVSITFKEYIDQIDEKSLLGTKEEAQEINENIIKLKGKTFYKKSDASEQRNQELTDLYEKLFNEPSDTTLFDEYNDYIDAKRATKLIESILPAIKEYQEIIDNDTLQISDDDTLYRAKLLLENYPWVRKDLQERYKHIYVDEYQDTTATQRDIVMLLGKDVETGQMRTDCLLFVGDAQQSIFRFTGAQVEIFNETEKEIGKLSKDDGEIIYLGYNFRSNKEIIDWVNESYEKLMPTYSKMETSRETINKKSLHGVYVFEADEYKKEDDVENVVNIIKQLANNDKYFIEVEDDDGNPYVRKIKYSDFMVISKNTTHMTSYVDKLAKEGIPSQLQGRIKIDNNVLSNYINLLQFFASHKSVREKISAVEVFNGIRATDIKQEILYGSKEKTQSKGLVEQLEEIQKDITKKNVTGFGIAQYLAEHEEYYFDKETEYSIYDIRSIKIKLYQMINTCLNSCDGDLNQLVKEMRRYLEVQVEREDQLESDENAVRIINVHKSKGLTAKIVIIADRRSEKEIQYAGFKKDGKYYPSVIYSLNPYSSAIVSSYKRNIVIKETAKKDEQEENIRLQYVATTRAANTLIIMPAIEDNSWFSNRYYANSYTKTYTDWQKWLEEREEDETQYVSTNNMTIESSKLNVDCIISKVTSTDYDNLINNLSKCVEDTENPSKFERSSKSKTVSDELFEEDIDEEETTENIERPVGKIFGNVMHRSFELMILSRDKLLESKDASKDIEGIIKRAIKENKEDIKENDEQKFFDYLLLNLPIYWQKKLIPIIENAKEIYPEFAFSYYIPTDEIKEFESIFSSFGKKFIESENYWINGKADLVVLTKDDEVIIYDYKSDKSDGMSLKDFEDSLKHKYEYQLKLYEYTMKKLFNKESVKTEFIHLYVNEN